MIKDKLPVEFQVMEIVNIVGVTFKKVKQKLNIISVEKIISFIYLTYTASPYPTIVNIGGRFKIARVRHSLLVILRGFWRDIDIGFFKFIL